MVLDQETALTCVLPGALSERAAGHFLQGCAAGAEQIVVVPSELLVQGVAPRSVGHGYLSENARLLESGQAAVEGREVAQAVYSAADLFHREHFGGGEGFEHRLLQAGHPLPFLVQPQLYRGLQSAVCVRRRVGAHLVAGAGSIGARVMVSD